MNWKCKKTFNGFEIGADIIPQIGFNLEMRSYSYLYFEILADGKSSLFDDF